MGRRHNPPYAWVMNFYEGLASNAGNTTGSYHARCVRAATGSGAATYTTVTAGEAQDNHTGLIWQRPALPRRCRLPRRRATALGSR